MFAQGYEKHVRFLAVLFQLIVFPQWVSPSFLTHSII
ncbi:hypothetical protein BCE_1862 [Bacillus cereus ATCC 10987]|uniref:Uncharacterized protein n=1 Tax=Bacillus cereus (strain ATCC 10987 / NRS 248) TaxID=222523 RepID=Q73AB8_BACC1|nr:hypothetical protein BCE_1862 [Bacillus cereus ATCC 10987]